MVVINTHTIVNNCWELVIQDGIAWFSGQNPTKKKTINLVRYDLSTDSESSSVVNGKVTYIAVDEKYAWAVTATTKKKTNQDTDKKTKKEVYVLARVNKETGEIIDTTNYTQTAQASGIAIGSDSIWLSLRYGGYVVQVDSESGDLGKMIPVVEYDITRPNTELKGIAYGEGAVWVGHPSSGSLIRIDPETKAVTHVIAAEGQVSHPEVGGGLVWMISGPETISWFNPANLATEK